jgi:hypothetical protein
MSFQGGGKYLRLHLRCLSGSALEATDYVGRLVISGKELKDKFTTAERDQVRQRPFGEAEG